MVRVLRARARAVCARQGVLRFDHVFGRPSRARAPTTRPRLWCANGRFRPALTCQSAIPGGPPEPSNVRPCHGFAPLKTKSDDPSTRNRRIAPPEPSKEHASATLRCPTRTRRTAGVTGQKRAEPFRVRPCQDFAMLEAKSDILSTQNPQVQKRAPSRVRPAKVSRPSRPKETTLPRKIHGSKSARRDRQSPLECAPAMVSRPSKAKVTRLARKIPPDPSTAKVSRPSRPKVTTFPREIHGFRAL